ncbi:MAG TPA: hypothetical protein VE035_12050 [Puia sp.]|nr:hypothetical protein [Puia sp.]
MRKPIPFSLLAAFTVMALPGCFYRERAYFQSPYNGNLETYHTTPLRSDSIRSATYASGSFTTGTANEHWRDNQYYFTGAIHRSHNFGRFEAYYGANASLGKYQVDSMSSYPAPGASAVLINKMVGGKSFGGYGLAGGINLALPMGRSGGELRLPVLSFSVQREFGNYANFRNHLPDTAANTIFKGRVVSTLGVGMELAFKLRNGMIGLKGIAGGALVNSSDRYVGNESTNYGMVFFSETFTVVINRITGFGQLNAGNHALGLQMGVQYQIGARNGTKGKRHQAAGAGMTSSAKP